MMRSIVGKGKFLRLISDDGWEFVERVKANGVVAIVPVTNDRRLVLTEQFRAAVGRNVIDLPAGLSGDTKGQEDEPLTKSAHRELLEETGYVAKKLERVADCPTSPGLTSEIVTFFVARDLRQESAGGGVESERIVIHTPSLRFIDRWLSQQVAAGKHVDAKVYAGLYFARRFALKRSPKPAARR